jgi:peptidyl-tRNA hydrolase, PTH1 family
MDQYLLVGLGNPGSSYAGNRHNIGFMAVDRMVSDYQGGKTALKFGGQLSEITVDGRKVYCFKPMGYMNISGVPTSEMARFYKIPLERIIVIHDELDLPLGKLRVKRGGSSGGHNGLKSIDAHMGADYLRMRLGISHPGIKDMVASYVLSDFRKEEAPTVERIINEISRHLPSLLAGDEAGFMNKIVLATKE